MLDTIENTTGYSTPSNPDVTLTQFSQWVERGRLDSFADKIMITPQLAMRMLEDNADNRPVKPLLVNNAAADILAGRWRVNGETIIVSQEGFLNDGQNRLLAIIKANMAAMSFVVFGVERDSRVTVDSGKSRTLRDVFGMDGIANASRTSLIVSLHLAYTRGQYSIGSANTGTRQEILAHYKQNKKMFDDSVRRIMGEDFARSAGEAPLACAYTILAARHPLMASEFYNLLFNGINLGDKHPVVMLRSRLLGTSTIRSRRWERMQIIFLYWNAWREGKQMRKHPSLERSYPEIQY